MWIINYCAACGVSEFPNLSQNCPDILRNIRDFLYLRSRIRKNGNSIQNLFKWCIRKYSYLFSRNIRVILLIAMLFKSAIRREGIPHARLLRWPRQERNEHDGTTLHPKQGGRHDTEWIPNLLNNHSRHSCWLRPSTTSRSAHRTICKPKQE